MKLIIIIIDLNMLLISPPAFAKKCEECPASKPCVIVIPKGDKCNTCEVKVHCSNGYWYKSKNVCTNVDCNQLTPIENPYDKENEE